MRAPAKALAVVALPVVAFLVASVAARDPDGAERSWRSGVSSVAGRATPASTRGIEERPARTERAAPLGPESAARSRAPRVEGAAADAAPTALSDDLDDLEAASVIEDLEARGDADGLLALFRSDESLLRFEALRAYLRLEEPTTAARLTSLLASEKDPCAQALLGEALAAGGDAADAGALARLLADASPSRRLAAAAAIAEIAERAPLAPGLIESTVVTLESLARGEQGFASDATRALAVAGARGVEALARLAADTERPGMALAAAEVLVEVSSPRGRTALEALAVGARDANVRRLAAAYLEVAAR